MANIEIHTVNDLELLNAFGKDAVFHGTHVSPEGLGFVAVGKGRRAKALIPHPARQFSEPTSQVRTLRPGNLAVVSFYDQTQRGGAAFNAAVGPARERTLPNEHRRSFKQESTGTMTYELRKALWHNVRPDDEGYMYAVRVGAVAAINARLDNARIILPTSPASPDQPHDKWALGSVLIDPNKVITVFGSYIIDLAERGDLQVVGSSAVVLGSE